MPVAAAPTWVLTLDHIGFEAAARLLESLGLQLARVADGEAIPGSFWGDCEAGLVGSIVYARGDTPKRRRNSANEDVYPCKNVLPATGPKSRNTVVSWTKVSPIGVM